MELKIKALSPKIGTEIPLPRFATAGAACMDLCACIDEAVIKVIAGPEKKSRVVIQRERKLTAYHEAGHAVAGFYCKHHPRVHEITIIPRGQAGGYTMYLPEKDRRYVTKGEMFEDIVSSLGGRVAEELIFDDITTGASNDIEQATKLARAMITRYGMSDDFDMVALETVNNQYLGGDASLACSAETQTKIDQRVVELVKKQHEKAIHILTENRAKLDELAQYLYEKETITGEEFMNIVNAK